MCWSANLPWWLYDFNILEPCCLHRMYRPPNNLLPIFLSWRIIVGFWRSQTGGNSWCTGNSWPNSLIFLIEMHTDCTPPSPPLNSPLPTMWFIQDEKSSEGVGVFFPQMTPTFYSLSPSTGNRALNNDRIAVTHTPMKRYLRCTINISILVEHLNYLFMAIPCLHQGCISWQVRWLMIQQIVKSFFGKN